MFEDRKTKPIHDEMLDTISNEYDKTIGAFIYDATRPAAMKFEEAYEDMSEVAGLTNVENLAGDELTRFINQRTGQDRRESTHAIGIVNVTGNGTILAGDLFQTESGVQFEAIEDKRIQGTDAVRIRAVEPGETGNVPAGQINSFPVSLQYINSVTNPEPTYDGFDQEPDEVLRQRYYERIRTPATSGNIYHYRNWAKEVPGVGDVRIVPLWDGPNTVKVVIIDSNMDPASAELVKSVQDYIDPGSTGLGDGEAPIGAFCTVVSATNVPVYVNFDGVLADGYDTDAISTNVSAKLDDYFQSVAFRQNFISYAQIGRMILESEGVVDYTDLTINGGNDNITLTDEEVATLGGVTVVTG